MRDCPRLHRSPIKYSTGLQVLIAKAKGAAEEALRLLLFALNGLAALSAIDQDPASAIESYREVSSCLLHLLAVLTVQEGFYLDFPEHMNYFLHVEFSTSPSFFQLRVLCC